MRTSVTLRRTATHMPGRPPILVIVLARSLRAPGYRLPGWTTCTRVARWPGLEVRRAPLVEVSMVLALWPPAPVEGPWPGPGEALALPQAATATAASTGRA